MGGVSRPEDDPAWQSFCAEVAPLGHAPKPAPGKLAAIGITAPLFLAPTHTVPWDARQTESDFADLLAEWERHGGHFAEPVPVRAAPAPQPATPALDLAASLPKLRKALTGHSHPTPKSAASPTVDQWHNLDSASVRRLKRGQMPIDAVLDLHGQNLAEAFQSLTGMVRLARMRGFKLLLVITGKGRKNSPQEGIHHPFDGDGKIRRALPSWLADASIAPHLVGAGTAHRAHGGSGAFYLLLRRRTEGLEAWR